MKKNQIQRYTPGQRSNHWVVAFLFILAALSGLALFHPAMFWLSNLFGGGPWTRILHPFIGVAMFLLFMGLVIRFWHHNLMYRNDLEWLKHAKDVMADHEDKVPPVGRYNGGQKVLFWFMLMAMLVLLVTGIIIWRQYFSHFFGIDIIRLAALLHALSALGLIIGIIVHVYAGFWVKGTMDAMLTGYVSRAWVRKHHGRWMDEIEKQEREDRQ